MKIQQDIELFQGSTYPVYPVCPVRFRGFHATVVDSLAFLYPMRLPAPLFFIRRPKQAQRADQVPRKPVEGADTGFSGRTLACADDTRDTGETEPICGIRPGCHVGRGNGGDTFTAGRHD